MLWLYRLFFLPAFVVILPGYLRRMWRRGGFRENFAQRFGAVPRFGPPATGKKRVWIQAVSVGEMLAVAPVVEHFARCEDVEVYITTTTTTGYAVGCQRYKDRVMGVGYFPLDFWPCSARAWRRLQPDLAVLMESELWPEHLHQARKRGVPVVLINARLSDRSFARLSRVPWLVARLYRKLDRILASSVHDADRLLSLGCPRDRLDTTGNLKLDVSIKPVLDAHAVAALRSELGLPDGFLIMGSSTWPGEEAALIDALELVRRRGFAARLLLVPRHAERRDEIAPLFESGELVWHLRSRGVAPGPVDVCVADTTGEMVKLLQVADLVFVGRSLSPNDGGQTPVEAAALGRAILFGPNMTNFREIAQRLIEAEAAIVVADAADVSNKVVALVGDEVARSAMAAAAREWHASNRGAVQRTWQAIESLLRRSEAGGR